MTILVLTDFQRKSLKVLTETLSGRESGLTRRDTPPRHEIIKTKLSLELRNGKTNNFWNTQENLQCSTDIFSSSCFYE